MPTVSIIVPVYNVEQYLPRCIDSILAQSFTDFELLLIDDGSSDNSGKICDEYARKDNRIRVFHKGNGGVSSARNLGIEQSCGEYIGFVDSDDCIFPHMYKLLYDGISTNRAELSCGRFCCNGAQIKTTEGSQMLCVAEASRYFFKSFNLFIWDKLFSRAYIDNLRFDENIRCGEDAAFLVEYLARVNKVFFIDSCLYNHIDNLDSITHAINKAEVVLSIPKVNYRVYHAIKLYIEEAKEAALEWAVNDVIFWSRKVKNEGKLSRKMMNRAWALRISALFCASINFKVRVLFFLGYYGWER